jgi:hypothetical protein
MLILWLVAGTLYYQMMRHPSIVVTAVRAVWPADSSPPELQRSTNLAGRD